MRGMLAALFLVVALLMPAGNEAQAFYQNIRGKSELSKTSNPTECDKLRKAADEPGMLDEITSSGGAICPCTPYPSLWIERIVSCFAEVPGGLYYNAIRKIIGSGPFHTFYNTVVYATILLAVTLFAVNLAMGSLQNLKKDAFTLLLKVTGVLLFFDNYTEIYGMALESVQLLLDSINKAIGNIGNMCTTGAPGATSPNLWARWDCLFTRFTGLVGGYIGLGVIGYMTAWLFSGGTGVAIAGGMAYVIVTILIMGMRLVYTYLSAILAISFLFLLAPLFVPAILFGSTYEKFSQWFKLILAYMIQPMVLTLFMVLMLAALEFTIFVGPTSLFGILANAEDGNPKRSMSFSELMATQGKGASLTNGLMSAVTGSNTDWTSFITLQSFLDFTQQTDSSVYTTNPDQPDAPSSTMVNTGVGGAQPAVSNNAPKDAAGSYEGALETYQIDEELMAEHLGIDNTLTWMQNLLLQLLASSILVMVLYSMLQVIPQITHDLTAQRFGREFGGATKTRGIGESEMKRALEGGKEAIRRGKETGDHAAAFESVAKDFYKTMVTGRRSG